MRGGRGRYTVLAKRPINRFIRNRKIISTTYSARFWSRPMLRMPKNNMSHHVERLAKPFAPSTPFQNSWREWSAAAREAFERALARAYLFDF